MNEILFESDIVKLRLEKVKKIFKIDWSSILAILTNSPNTESVISDYLKYFDLWKNNDLDKKEIREIRSQFKF